MRPQFIYLVRHGESEANVDRTKYAHTPDWKMQLTLKGIEQAHRAGQEIMDAVEETQQDSTGYNPKFDFYVSPWARTRQTAKGIIETIEHNDGIVSHYREDPRLREQEWGNFQNDAHRLKIDTERDKYGTFFYRMRDGESGADVFDRISSFFDTLHREFEKETTSRNVVIVTHGFTLRIFLMRWFNWSVEEFEELANPENCAVVKMERLPEGKKYRLVSILKKKDVYESQAPF